MDHWHLLTIVVWLLSHQIAFAVAEAAAEPAVEPREYHQGFEDVGSIDAQAVDVGWVMKLAVARLVVEVNDVDLIDLGNLGELFASQTFLRGFGLSIGLESAFSIMDGH